jgi:hypothetical protein
MLFSQWLETELSQAERDLLGKPKVGKSGKPSAYNYPSEEEWGKLRP